MTNISFANLSKLSQLTISISSDLGSTTTEPPTPPTPWADLNKNTPKSLAFTKIAFAKDWNITYKANNWSYNLFVCPTIYEGEVTRATGVDTPFDNRIWLGNFNKTYPLMFQNTSNPPVHTYNQESPSYFTTEVIDDVEYWVWDYGGEMHFVYISTGLADDVPFYETKIKVFKA